MLIPLLRGLVTTVKRVRWNQDYYCISLEQLSPIVERAISCGKTFDEPCFGGKTTIS